MASSSSSIFTGAKFSLILDHLNSRENHCSGFIKNSRNKVRFNQAANRVRVKAQSLIPNGLWEKQTTNKGRVQRIARTSFSEGHSFCITCKKTQPGIRRSLPGAFVDRTSFTLSRSRLTSSLIKQTFSDCKCICWTR